MAQQNEPAHALDPATAPGKRKRGRPRKDDIPGTESGGRRRRRGRNTLTTTAQDLIGQPVSGILDGIFDAGFLITVRVGSGPLLRGMVFDPRLIVPVSAENDVAPHITMSKRVDFPTPAESLKKRRPTVSSPISNNTVANYGSQVSASGLKGSEDVISAMHLVGSKETGLVPPQPPDNQRQPGELAMDFSSKLSEGNEAPVDAKAGHTSQTIPGDESSSQPKSSSTDQTHPTDEATCELKLRPTSATPSAIETTDEMKPDHKSQILLELTMGSTSLATSVDGTPLCPVSGLDLKEAV